MHFMMNTLTAKFEGELAGKGALPVPLNSFSRVFGTLNRHQRRPSSCMLDDSRQAEQLRVDHSVFSGFRDPVRPKGLSGAARIWRRTNNLL